jgi:hypothetical protein
MIMLQEIHPDGDLLRVRATGEFSLEEAKRNFLEMMEAVALHKSKRVLVDGQTITGNPRAIERFYYGEFSADVVVQHQTRTGSGSIRFAYVLKEPVLDPKKFGETVAANRGMLIKVFDNLEEALEWLSTPSASKPDVY